MIDITRAAWIQLREVVLPFLVTQVHHTVPREDHAVAAVAGRHHAVEHIYAPLDGLEDIPGCSDAHEVARFILRQYVIAYLNHVVHHFRWFAYRQAAYGISVAV